MTAEEIKKKDSEYIMHTYGRFDIVLDHGKIIEDGKYDELIEKNGFFAELVARQRLDDVTHNKKI